LHPRRDPVLDTLITSKTRVRVLIKFFSNPETSSYLREIAEEFGESTNSVRVELNRLSEAGLLKSRPNGRTIAYRANPDHPLFPEIQRIVSKFLGLDKLALSIVDRLGNLDIAFVTGDYARGLDTGIIDLVIVGDVDQLLLARLSKKVEQQIKRRIRPLILDKAEYELLREKGQFDHALIMYNRKTEQSEIPAGRG
jgi:predicted transcriptional regulator